MEEGVAVEVPSSDQYAKAVADRKRSFNTLKADNLADLVMTLDAWAAAKPEMKVIAFTSHVVYGSVEYVILAEVFE